MKFEIWSINEICAKEIAAEICSWVDIGNKKSESVDRETELPYRRLLAAVMSSTVHSLKLNI